MTNTTFRNACGLDTEGHLSTARDVAVLSRYLLNTCPELLHYTGIWTDSLRNGQTQLVNTNKLLRRYEELRRQYEKNQKEIAHLQKAADDLHLWAFMGADKLHKRAFSMEKRIARLQTAERPREDKKLSVRFRQKEFFGDEVLVLEDVAKSYGEKKLFSGIDELIEPGERIALIGDNGTGKSTLLRCITGEETPDRGWIHLGPAVKSA